MFNHGTHLGVKALDEFGDSTTGNRIFSRLLAEASFLTLCAYERAIGEQLVPTIEEVWRDKN